MSIDTFMFAFDTEGVYVFGDYSNPQGKVSIIKASEDLCDPDKSELVKDGNIFPLTEENLETF